MHPMNRPAILVVTSLWPTPDNPSCGIFVARRLEGVDATIVGPRSYHGSALSLYLLLLWRALTARGRFVGVEAHVLFPTGLIGLLAASLRGLPLVVYAHGADVRDTARKNPVYRLLARWVARRAAAVITNSSANAELVRGLGRDPIVIPPGVDLLRFRPSPRPEQRRVLYVGGSRRRKGYDIATGLADTTVGPGLRDVPPEEMPALMAAHDVVLVPSRAEPFGVAAAEAIASGRWVIATHVDGLAEVVTDGVNGTLVSDGDYAGALAKVPDYDPFAVAETARGFNLDLHRERMAETWRTVLGTDSG